MRNILNWTQEWFAYLTLPIIYYTLRLFKATLFWVSIESHKVWSNKPTLPTGDLLTFISIVLLVVLYLVGGLWWALYSVIGLLLVVVLLMGLLSLRKWYRNRKNK